MKHWTLIASFFIILAILCSPVLAISKNDLISFYRDQSVPLTPAPTPAPRIPWPAKDDSSFVKPLFPTTSPTPATTEFLSICSHPYGAMVYLDGKFKGLTPITLTGLATGSHHLKLTKFGYADYTTDVTILTGRSCRGNIRPYPGCENWLPCISLQKATD
jgi:hypothetical protein